MMRQLSDATLHELQVMLRWFRQRTHQQYGDISGDLPNGPYYSRVVRLQGDNPANLADTTYPTQVDGAGVVLPAVFCSVNTSTIAYTASEEKVDIYSPGGWIPRLVELRVSFRGGVWIPDFVPLIPCRMDGSVTAPNTVTVEIRESGTMDTQTMTAHLDWMAGTSSAATDDEALIWLNERTQQWEIINLEC